MNIIRFSNIFEELNLVHLCYFRLAELYREILVSFKCFSFSLEVTSSILITIDVLPYNSEI